MRVTGPGGRTLEVPSGVRVTFGRAGTSRLVDFPVTTAPQCSRVAGALTQEQRGVRVECGQRPGAGALSVLDTRGRHVAAVGVELCCELPRFVVRLYVAGADGDAVFDFAVEQAAPARDMPIELAGGSTVTEPATSWTLTALLAPAPDMTWRSAVALARALQTRGRPPGGQDVGTVPSAQVLGRHWAALFGESRNGSYFTHQWEKGAAAWRLPGTPGAVGRAWLPQILQTAAAARVPSEEVLDQLWDRLATAAGRGTP